MDNVRRSLRARQYQTACSRRLDRQIYVTAALIAQHVAMHKAEWIVHVYAAIWVRGTIAAMTRGQVTGG